MIDNRKIRVKFLKDYDEKWKKDDVKLVSPELAFKLVGQQFAKMVDSPIKDRMIRWAENKGIGQYFTG